MALYNAPIKDSNHTLNAIKTALDMREELKKLNIALKKKGMQEIITGIGINTGEAIIGNIGSDKKMEYTAIGNTVNIAFRFQSKAKNNQVLISEETYNKVKHQVIAEKMGLMHLHNIKNDVQVYNVLSLR